MSEQRAQDRRAALIFNPIKVDEKKLRARVQKASKKAGWGHPLFYHTTPGDLGQEATAQALRDGADAVLVAGGDGTVRAVAEAMASTGVPLTIVPSGTGNLLARNLELAAGGSGCRDPRDVRRRGAPHRCGDGAS
ncbi:diacylglycerol/lipid kinase family protein [Microbacterium elymi]|uniref:Acylglycerol kinase family protein n=1 Tax=Microbacterium elymi TaxID=2909587 RepID=A0ABY5NHK0_9MICO|nr:acylglycerol kinase family protein [Microbacterium elymi]UUT34637.1 acylglycerol kinase family protein [Microbacterium elymi]